MKALVTGGCGFIGSHVVRALIRDGWDVTNLDKLTYAANPANLSEVLGSPNYRFVQGDLCDATLVAELVAGQDAVLNFAAETHVDRSLLDPGVFVRTDVEGVVNLLEAIRLEGRAHLVHMSTDEVFGSLEAPLEAAEDQPFAPSSPYSASKAAAELMIRAYSETYGLPVTILRSCNVYGPNQHLEKFIPLFTMRARAGESMPLYGDGQQQREWLFVEDFVGGLQVVLRSLHGSGVQAFHIGSGERIANIDVARRICTLSERPEELIRPVLDRPGHDRRYAINSQRLRTLGWTPQVAFEEGIAKTVAWYLQHGDAWANGGEEFAGYFERQYGSRLG